MRVKKLSVILFISILAISMGIASICKVAEISNTDSESTTYETEVYQAEVTLNSKDEIAFTEKETVTTTKPTTTKKQVKETITKKKETTTTKKSTTTNQASNNNPIKGSLDFDSNDALMLHKIAVAEAGGESVEGMALVMLVVLNRVYDDEFPDTIYGVLHQKNQFTPMVDGSYAKAQPNEKSHKAMELVISGWNESKGALYFESCRGSSWQSRNLTYLFEEGGHRYYK